MGPYIAATIKHFGQLVRQEIGSQHGGPPRCAVRDRPPWGPSQGQPCDDPRCCRNVCGCAALLPTASSNPSFVLVRDGEVCPASPGTIDSQPLPPAAENFGAGSPRFPGEGCSPSGEGLPEAASSASSAKWARGYRMTPAGQLRRANRRTCGLQRRGRADAP